MTGLILFSPRSPGGRGDDGRWILQENQGGGFFTRTPLYGPRPDQVEEAKAQAAGLLGWTPTWEATVPKSRYANPTWTADSRPSPESEPNA